MRVLHIEDDMATAATVKLMLESNGFVVSGADCGEDGADYAKRSDFDIIITDIGLPDISGFEVIKRVRAAHIATPIFVLSGHTSIEDKVRGLDLGADDYLTKPFHNDELLARIRAVIRRSNGCAQFVIRVGNVTMDFKTMHIEKDGTRIGLSKKEHGMLQYFVLRKGAVITRDMFIDRLYAGENEPDYRTIDIHIGRLRRKLKNAGFDDSFAIVTLYGAGYALEETKQHPMVVSTHEHAVGATSV